MPQPNYAENERIWFEKKDVPLAMCHRKGEEHRAYNWARQDGGLNEEQRAAYARGFAGLPFEEGERAS